MRETLGVKPFEKIIESRNRMAGAFLRECQQKGYLKEYEKQSKEKGKAEAEEDLG